ncbi:hypothetical protein TVAG_323280 [Trichomonas vaginalis G3]|uniref:Uncharacterized protein n=1 Tax=Trichomonas vaginalis (strain ATCC PRA-98 / G3) TaxID=412133 RepID=A2GKE0_TRIV3|nr:hypothetical protein TVAGG3_0469080 [Trichomonas vaginalis G3]EAX82380.1 hypothetical protein TVAG_323280 [Trichomonas vaginalis G3]KAI5514944.1 hypothetical protein TVAGG3_0469080 [Trichomonas vaginalis G3]|eukprot:XP_001295310.1 hypothetical protein [Trichomonas vaginalis G3]
MHGMYLKFESQLENTYNIWLSYIQFDTPDDFDVEEEDSTQEDEPQDAPDDDEFVPEEEYHSRTPSEDDQQMADAMDSQVP